MLILIILIAAIALFLYLQRQPNDFRYIRSAQMKAPASVIFDNVNDLVKWQAWSPWAKMDPNAKVTFDGTVGLGASTAWEGKKTGQGRMTITETRPSEFIRFKLEFYKPMKAVNTAEFSFRTEGETTIVNWSMYGPNTIMGKLMSLFINCGDMVGKQFEQGLADLKKIVETK